MAAVASSTSSSAGTSAKASTSVTSRLQSELMQIMMSGDSDCSAFPEGDDMFHWVGTVAGVADTPYSGHSYKLSIEFTADYPYKAPVIKFTTPIFHPNVDVHGNICLDILKEKWSATYSVKTVLISLQSLLGDPNVDSPLNVEAANMWANQTEYERVCRQKYDEATASSSS